MTARQFALKAPAAIFFILKLLRSYGHCTMVISVLQKPDVLGESSIRKQLARQIARRAQRTNKRSQFMDVIRCLSAGAVAERKTTEFTTAREAACYRRHTHLVTGTQGWTVGGG